ncbi:hypothetical protein QLR68_36420, partial [Micromonospora sp. DH15]|nr:hypothetical protein [Micromonospora sp. DH15]
MVERSDDGGRPATDGTGGPEPAPPSRARTGSEAARPGGTGAGEELGATVAALTADDVEPARRRQLLTRLVGQVRGRGLADLFKP